MYQKSISPSPVKSSKPYHPAPPQGLLLAQRIAASKPAPVPFLTQTSELFGLMYQKSINPSPLKSLKPYHPAPAQGLLFAQRTAVSKPAPVPFLTQTSELLALTYQKSINPSPVNSSKPYHPAPPQGLLLAQRIAASKPAPVPFLTQTSELFGLMYQKSINPSPVKSLKPYHPAPAQGLLFAQRTAASKPAPVPFLTQTSELFALIYQKSINPSPVKSLKPYHPAPAQGLLFAQRTAVSKPAP